MYVTFTVPSHGVLASVNFVYYHVAHYVIVTASVDIINETRSRVVAAVNYVVMQVHFYLFNIFSIHTLKKKQDTIFPARNLSFLLSSHLVPQYRFCLTLMGSEAAQRTQGEQHRHAHCFSSSTKITLNNRQFFHLNRFGYRSNFLPIKASNISFFRSNLWYVVFIVYSGFLSCFSYTRSLLLAMHTHTSTGIGKSNTCLCECEISIAIAFPISKRT